MASGRPGGPGSIRFEAARRGVSEYAIRQERGVERGVSRSQAAGHPRRGEPRLSEVRAPRTPTQLVSASPAQVDLRARQAQAVGALRRGEVTSVTGAERMFGLPRRSLRRDFPTAFGARGHVLPTDRETVPVLVVGPDGDQLVVTRSSRQRQLAAAHRRDIFRALSGEIAEREFRRRYLGKRVGGVELETDLERLVALQSLGRIQKGGPYPEIVR